MRGLRSSGAIRNKILEALITVSTLEPRAAAGFRINLKLAENETSNSGVDSQAIPARKNSNDSK
jgi:hypothetical protein